MNQAILISLIDDRLLLTRHHPRSGNQQIDLGHRQEADSIASQLEDVARLLRHLPKPNVEPPLEAEHEHRYTEEGIDRYFKAPPSFIPDHAAWDRDAPLNWTNLSDADLVRLYQKHLECYCEAMLITGEEPTYTGFREYLRQTRNED